MRPCVKVVPLSPHPPGGTTYGVFNTQQNLSILLNRGPTGLVCMVYILCGRGCITVYLDI